MTRSVNIIGKRFNMLTAIEFAEKREHGKKSYEYWLFKCDCGNEKVICKKSVIQGRIKSCKCLVKSTRFKLSPGEASFNILLYTYKNHANEGKRAWDLTKEQFKILTSQNCHYCGISPQIKVSRKKNNGDYYYNGLDRVDNAKGYTVNNVVTCCETCNRAKLEQTQQDFLNWIKRVYGHSKL